MGKILIRGNNEELIRAIEVREKADVEKSRKEYEKAMKSHRLKSR